MPLDDAPPPKCRRVLAGLYCYLLALLSFAFPGGAAAQETVYPTITSACEIDYPPFCFVDDEGEAAGFSVDLMRAALGAMGREVSFRTGPWTEVRSLLDRGEVAALPLVGRTPEREDLYDFAVPYMTMHGAIVVRDDTTGIRTLGDLRGRQVAVMQGDNAEEFLRREDRGILIHTTHSFTEALRELSEGAHDAVVVQRLVALRLIQQAGLENLRILGTPVDGFRQDFCFAVQPGDRDTLALLNEGLALVMGDGTYRHLHAKWFAAQELPSSRRIVVGGDYNYSPYEYLDEQGDPAGFNVDLIRAIARALDLDIEFRLGPWAEVVAALESGEIDVIQGMFYSAERGLKFDFSQAHMVNHYVGVVRRGEGPPPATLEDLAGKRIVVQEADHLEEILLARGFEAQVHFVETQEEVLQELAEGRHDCAVVVRIGALSAIKQRGWTNLVLARRPIHSAQYCIAVARGQEALLAEFSEGLRIVNETGEYRRIQEKWLGVYEEKDRDLLAILRFVAIILVPLVALLLAALLWSWSLRRQVALRTAALRASEARFRSLVEGAPDAIFVQADLRFVYVNNVLIRMLGAESAADLLGKPVLEHIHPSAHDAVRERIRVLNHEQRQVPPLEEIWLRLDGSEVPVDVSAIPIDYEGKHGALVFARDITERRHSQEALRSQDQLLREISAIAKIGGWDFDPATGEGTWTDEVARIYEVDPARATSVDFSLNFYKGASRAAIEQAVRKAATHGTPYDLELELYTAQGNRKWVRTIGQPRLEDGKVVQVRGSFQDISEQKAAQARIEHLNRVLLAIRDVNKLIVREWDRDTMLQEACRLLVQHRSYTSALIIQTDKSGHPFAWAVAGMDEDFAGIEAQLQHGEVPPCCLLAKEAEGAVLLSGYDTLCGECQTMATTNDTDALSVQLLSGGTAYGYLAVTLSHVVGADKEEQALFAEMAGDLGYALNAMANRTALEQAEHDRATMQQQLFQAQKMEAVGQLAGGIAHDFNNILQAILGYAQILLDDFTGTPEQRADLEEIQKGALRAATLTRQLLAFSRRQVINPKPLDLNQLIENLLSMLRRVLSAQVRLEWLPGKHLGVIFADAGTVEQVLMNLCVNARDAMPNGGALCIETQNVVIDSEYCATHVWAKPGRHVLLSVTDTGCGMDKETLDHIFEPFFTTKEEGKGTGLGLATVYGIVKQHEGMISVYSEPGKGTTFKIYLPLCESRAASVGNLITEVAKGGSETILLAEDNELVQRMAKKVLELAGYTVLTANDGEEAVDLFRKHSDRIALVLLDVVMPQMGGIEALARIRAMGAEVPVLFSSAYSENAVHTNFVLHEGLRLVQKPYAPATLLRAVRVAIEEGKAADGERTITEP